MSDRPPDGKYFKLLANVHMYIRAGQLQTLAVLILVCLILEGFDSRWLLILYGLSNEIIPTLNEKIGHLDLKILYYLIKIFIRNERTLFFRSSLGWRLKIAYLHLNLFPKYIWTHIWDWTWFCLKFLMGLVLYPWVGWLEYPVYFAATIYATLGILFATAIEQFNLWKWNLIEDGRNKEEKIHLIKHFQMYPPLPHRHMVMQGVQLHDEFVGFLRKLGFLFVGFMTVLNKIGKNSFLALMLLSTFSFTMTKESDLIFQDGE